VALAWRGAGTHNCWVGQRRWWGPNGWHDNIHWYGVWPRIYRLAPTTGGAEFLQAPCRLRWESARWHRFDRTAGYDMSYGDEIEVQLLKLVLQRYREVDYWSHPSEAQHVERLVPVKEDCCRSWYELWEDWCVRKELHVVLEGAKYVKVVKEDGASITTKVVVKQLCYMPVTLRLK
jgi:hypothetical protein